MKNNCLKEDVFLLLNRNMSDVSECELFLLFANCCIYIIYRLCNVHVSVYIYILYIIYRDILE